MHIQPFKAVFPNLDYITSPDTFFGNVKEEYRQYYKSGFFNQVPTPGLYIYQILTDGKGYTGLIACTDIRDYLEGHIKKHENTLAEKEQQQMDLLLNRKAMVKPVLLTYPPVEAIEAFLFDYIDSHAPFLSVHFENDGQTHLFWEVTEANQIQLIQALFERYVPSTYIADGHHRTSTMALLFKRMKKKGADNPFDRILVALFATSELEIHDYNRIVEGFNDCTLSRFMARLSQVAEIEVLDGPARPAQKHEIVLFINREWYSFRWKDRILQRYEKEPILLDVHLLNELILEDILGIQDIRTDQRVRYIEGKQGLEGFTERVGKSEDRMGFFLYPVSMQDFLDVSDADQVLPPKSTWFEPRMRNGLIVQGF